ncbi:MAG: hypothetical protein LUQ59_04900 [Methanothrix sp.]|nr:hypothetical protein [Methanothrix sp.]
MANNMTIKTILIVLLFLTLAANASSQGYMGTVSTGTGIIPVITVGKSLISASSVGAISTQANLTGDWSMDLKGSEKRHLDLQVYQEKDLILGSGQMSDQQKGLDVTASGSIAGDGLTVFVFVVDTRQVFRLKLSLSGVSLAGEYESLSKGTGIESGTATGQVTSAEVSGQATVLGRSVSPSATSGARVGSAVGGTTTDNNVIVLGNLTGK